MSVLFHAPKNDHKWSTVYERHVYRGSLVRHVAVDNAIILVAKPTSLRLIRCVRLYRVLRLYCVLLWGWNCNFPLSSVALYADFYPQVFGNHLGSVYLREWVSGGTNSSVVDNVVYGVKYGIVDDDEVSNKVVTGNSILGNVVSEYSTYGIVIQEYAGGDLVEGNSVVKSGAGSTNYGIFVLNSMNNTIVGNNVRLINGAQYCKGVRLEGANGTRFKSNTVDCGGAAGDGGIGVSVAEGSDWMIFRDNSYIATYAGVTLAAGCDWNTLVGEDFSLCGTVWYNSGTSNSNNCYTDGGGYNA